MLFARRGCWATVYPRVCGGNICLIVYHSQLSGLSPRVRGKHHAARAMDADLGSIPACAGETGSCFSAFGCEGVYPRVCGGNLRKYDTANWQKGLSPRVRGKPCGAATSSFAKRSIPACAGETVHADAEAVPQVVYPRVCGGNERECPAGCMPPGSIPACAGETTACGRDGADGWVYPRVCGGNAYWRGYAAGFRGLSPRVRGKRG